MSTDYATQEKIEFSSLYDGRLERFNVREHIKDGETSDNFRCLTDGRNYLWVFSGPDGMLDSMSRHGGNAVGKILAAVADAFGTEIYSEYEPQYWGFDTHEEWDLAWAKISEENENKFYASIIAYVKGEANDLIEGRIGMLMANIAKELITENPDLILEENKTRLMEEVNRIWSAKHEITITLSEQDIALADLSVTHEDELHRA
jgi:hypothetical protein